jgi:hypothetical protein
MTVKLAHGESAPPQANGGRRVPRIAVARRIDSKRPTRAWSLLLPPSFRPGRRRSTVRHAWTLIERMALQVLDAMFPLLMLVLFVVILFVVFLAFALLGLKIVGAV